MSNSSNDFFRDMVSLFSELVIRKLNEADGGHTNLSGEISDAELEYRYNTIKSFCEKNKNNDDYKAFEEDFKELLKIFEEKINVRKK